jgi:O-antigen/teichoic acid export membrane protein
LDSIKKRFIFTLAARLVSFIVGIATAGIIPRSLGPVNYGNYQFLQSMFLETKNLLDLYASGAFYSDSSKNQRTGTSTVVFLVWEFLQNALIFLFISLTVILGFYGSLWPHQEVKLIYAVAGIAMLAILEGRFLSYADSKALTVFAQIAKLCCYVIQVMLIVFLFLNNRLDLNAYVMINYAVLLISIAILGVYFRIKWKSIFINDISRENLKKTLSYYKSYSSPLIAYTIVGFLYTYFNRWFLQLIGGGQEQGYYSLAFNCSQIIMIFSCSMTPIFWREMSLSFEKKDIERMRFFFGRNLKIFFFATCLISAFICVQSEIIIKYLAGKAFASAIFPFIIMAFYPVFQTYGQLGGTFFLATDRTRQYGKIGIMTMLAGTMLTYFLLAPQSFLIPGLGLGSLGLAIQMVMFQIFYVNILLYFNCRYLSMSFKHYLMYQGGVILMMVSISYLTGRLSSSILSQFSLSKDVSNITGFFSSGIIYTAIICALAYLFPVLTGIERKEYKSIINRMLPFRNAV